MHLQIDDTLEQMKYDCSQPGQISLTVAINIRHTAGQMKAPWIYSKLRYGRRVFLPTYQAGPRHTLTFIVHLHK